ncbi:MAG: TetR/AcrR family transcriptional regulator, partial [Treponema sp.]|nr:TetR/AcrR family transcriptional regulator [Treponema sp.]
MTKQDIIEAAFRVWGRQSYQSTSLTEVAQELGVSKPALYRHFKNKDALFDALFENFFDRYAAFIKPAYKKTTAVLPNKTECFSIMLTATVEYFIRNVYDFVFFVIEVFEKEEQSNKSMLERGVDMSVFVQIEDAPIYPYVQLIMATMVFTIARFHRLNSQADETISEEKMEEVRRFIAQRIEFGLGFDRETIEKIKKMDYGALERKVTETLNFSKSSEENKENKRKSLFDAIASAVAEAGPWKVSMDFVARKSSLSKSSLYSYFADKDDMMEQFFATEFDRLVSATEKGRMLSGKPEEQLYLIIIAMAAYLRSRPDILATINWLKTRTDAFIINWQRVRDKDAETTFRNPRFFALFSDIFSKISVGNTENVKRNLDEIFFPYIIPFLVVNILINGGGGHKEDFRSFRI